MAIFPGADVGSAFERAASAVREMTFRPELLTAEAPAPKRMAPESLAITADAVVADEDLGSGRLVILHNAAGEEAWEGDTRLVLYVDALVEPELAADPLLPEVGWTWLEESLEGLAYVALGGTVTRVQSQSFDAMADREPEGRMQIRASWTATHVADLSQHVRAWADLLATSCGLEPLAAGVAMLSPRHSGLRH